VRTRADNYDGDASISCYRERRGILSAGTEDRWRVRIIGKYLIERIYGGSSEGRMDSSLGRTHSARRRYGWWLAPVIVVLAIAGAWTARTSILRGLAEWWVISDPLDHADGIVTRWQD
jgi:hypothetical protein